MHSIQTKTITLEVGDGTSMNAYCAFPESGSGYPGLLVFQEAFGVNAHIRDVTERFAKEGYVALAPELFHRSAPGFAGDYNDYSQSAPHMQAITTEGLEADTKAAFAELANMVGGKPIGAIGYCMGGRTAFLANSVVPLSAAISYYGGGIAEALLDRVPIQFAPVLMFWGGQDAHIPKEKYRAITDAFDAVGKPYTNVVFSYANHGFFCDARGSYHPKAAQEAWALTLQFLKDNLTL